MNLIQELEQALDTPEGEQALTKIVMRIARTWNAAQRTLKDEAAGDWLAAQEEMLQRKYRSDHAKFVEGDLIGTLVSREETVEAERLRQLAENAMRREQGYEAVAQDGRAYAAPKPESEPFDSDEPRIFAEGEKMTPEEEAAMDELLVRAAR